MTYNVERVLSAFTTTQSMLYRRTPDLDFNERVFCKNKTKNKMSTAPAQSAVNLRLNKVKNIGWKKLLETIWRNCVNISDPKDRKMLRFRERHLTTLKEGWSESSLYRITPQLKKTITVCVVVEAISCHRFRENLQFMILGLYLS